MTNTMTMQEQIHMSGLEITSSSSSSSSSLLEWNSTNQWSPLLGGARQGQACVIVNGNDDDDGTRPSCENDATTASATTASATTAQTIVVIGGQVQNVRFTNSVIIWDPSTMEWRTGPNLTTNRRYLVAVVCHDKVYAIGGRNDSNNTVLDTMEYIHVSSLLVETMETLTMTTTTRQQNNDDNNSQWTRLQCRLLSPREECSAVVVHDRYVVILGGYSGIEGLSSMDIMDTAPHNNNNNNGEPTIVAGPSMNWARYTFGAAVMDNRIFVVGGYVNGGGQSTLVESFLFRKQQQDKDNTRSTINASCTFPNSSSWRIEQDLNLSTNGVGHAVAKMGSCLIVVVGGGGGGRFPSVQVLDVPHGIVWNLPNLIVGRFRGCSMVTLSNCLVVLGGNRLVDSVESLTLTVNRKHERCFKFLKFLMGIEFLGRRHEKEEKW